jgi:hypothetical protein
MSGQFSSYTSDTNNTNIQADFETNLQTQLDSIKKIQEQQTELYSKLEVLGASTNISAEKVQNEITDIFKQIETLNEVKNTIFHSLITSYELNQSQLNASRYAYADSIMALKIIEENLNNKKKILNEALAIRDNSERMVGVNTYYTRRYEEHSNVLKYVILFCGIIIIAIFLMKIGIINNTISSIIIIASLAVGIIIIGGKVWDLSRRSNIDYDRYRFKFNPNDAPPDSKNSTSINTDMTYGSNIFRNVCNKLTNNPSSNASSGTSKSASASATPPPPPPATSTTRGTGAAGSFETFILKNPKNKFDDKTYGCPLASNETSYSYSDYEAY